MSSLSGRLWPAAIIAVLAVTVIANIVMLRLASDPDAGALEPDAYAKAVAWDSTAAERDASLELGWSATARLVPAAESGMRVEVTLADRAGRPLAGARVRVEAIHNGLARRLPAQLVPTAAGTYGATLPLSRPGMWELRLHATRDADRFATSLRADLEAGAP